MLLSEFPLQLAQNVK